MKDSLREILQKTLDDGRVSRSEKKALKQIIHDDNLGSQALSQARKEAFELACSAMKDPRDKEVIQWLEEIVKLTILPPVKPPRIWARFSPGVQCRQEIISLIKKASSTLDICVFTITDNGISREIESAHKRGVALRIITDDRKSGDLGSDVKEFEQRGIPLRMDNSPLHMHHKFAIIDGSILLSGSYNWTRGAMEQQENFMVTDDAKMVKTFGEEFEKLWKKFT